jgi:hypothetical protein
MKPIETRFRGHNYRSRLEARWAVFFHTLGIDAVYECEGYDLGPAGYYLPDWWLPQVSMWAEAKPIPLTEDELRKARALIEDSSRDKSGKGILLLVGPPDFKEYECIEWSDSAGILGLTHLNYALTTRYLHTEHRFFCEGSPTCDYWPTDYIAAVHSARSARFEHGENPDVWEPRPCDLYDSDKDGDEWPNA